MAFKEGPDLENIHYKARTSGTEGDPTFVGSEPLVNRDIPQVSPVEVRRCKTRMETLWCVHCFPMGRGFMARSRRVRLPQT
jgi:hypothetical protein